ncbi:hypothetical protein HOK68_00045 [Candidatus Woesearchaeota archaeon]|jgi:hypothetical protein|nr:hypothetical protein [Candidatus Woesearchaeota archaeon]MBT4387825.1 hypothetical protein [Candidatus Woesearchaeota archaeon]MBT4595644.1 hypothetical protein [Candidatus Woesearchaeota archaeon]MBT5740873.1 hypothetical protein [Candidatus Woesearchaeota archaeon]MBT6505152.1 hypothetical protein [Candidatus Woesearchaeota archaeon]
MEEINELYQKIKESDEYKELVQNNLYLTNIFIMLDDSNNLIDRIQFGFYNKEKDKIITLSIHENKIIKSLEQEIAKKSDQKLEELNIENLNINLNEIEEMCVKEIKKINDKIKINRKMFLIQNQEKPIFLNTFLAEDGNIFSLKIDISTKEMLEFKKFNVKDLINN